MPRVAYEKFEGDRVTMKCTECKVPLTKCIKVILTRVFDEETGQIVTISTMGKTPTGYFCTNKPCWRYTEIPSETWRRKL